MEQQIAASGDAFRANTKGQKKRSDDVSQYTQIAINPQLNLPPKASSISVSEVIKLIAFFVGLLAGCILLGFFIGGFANAWDGVTLFLEAIKLGTDWGVGVLVASLVVPFVPTLVAGRTRIFSGHSSVLESELNAPDESKHFSLVPEKPCEDKTHTDKSLIIHSSPKNNVSLTVKPPASGVTYKPLLWAPAFSVPDDIWGAIVKNLRYPDISNLMKTCRFFNTNGAIKKVEEVLKSDILGMVIEGIGCKRTFVLSKNGILYGYGDNSYNQLGIGKRTIGYELAPAQRIPININIRQVFARESCTFVLSDNGVLYVSGPGKDHGQLGLGDQEAPSVFTPVFIEGIGRGDSIRQVILGYNSTFALSSNGMLYACGHNYHGHLGLKDENRVIEVFKPVIIEGIGKGDSIRQVFVAEDFNKTGEFSSVGDHSTFVLSTNGMLYACGRNTFGELGLKDKESRYLFKPVLIEGIDNHDSIRQVIVGDTYNFVLSTNGILYACGRNSSGQLGLGDEKDRSVFTPVYIEGIGKNDSIRQIIVGDYCVFMLSNNGVLYACGYNDKGRLGLGDEKDRSVFSPVLIGGIDKDVYIRRLVIGSYCCTLVQLSNDAWYGCGRNEKVGINHSVFVPIATEKIKKISAHEQEWHSVMLDTSYRNKKREDVHLNTIVDLIRQEKTPPQEKSSICSMQ